MEGNRRGARDPVGLNEHPQVHARMKAQIAVLIATLLIAAPVASADPIGPDDVVECVKDPAGCSTMDKVIWVVRCIGDSLNGHHCTQE